jgi:hypothetical protein
VEKRYNKNPETAGESNLEQGTSFREKCDPSYQPRTSGQGERPESAKSSKVGHGMVIK